MAQTKRDMLIDPMVDNNPITLQVLGICSAVAVASLPFPRAAKLPVRLTRLRRAGGRAAWGWL